MLRALAASFSYFSILPGPSFDEGADRPAIAYLPLVGLTIGSVAGLVATGIYHISPYWDYFAALVAWLLSIALSGAIHIDGFLDCCDGLFAMATPQRRLEIMRDPHHGTYAIVGMAMLAWAWIDALGANANFANYPAILAFTGGASRVFGALSARVIPWIGLLVVVPMVWYFNGQLWHACVALAVGAIVAFLVRAFASARLEGKLNGDCYGAIIVVSEVAMLWTIDLLRVFR